MPGVDRKDLFQILVAVPPVNEQAEMVKSIEAEFQSLNDAIYMAQREIKLLPEYRTRLIADVVTGKLDVREVGARLPYETGEPELIDEGDAMSTIDDESVADLDTVQEDAEA